MAKYRVLQSFKDIKKKDTIYEADDVIDMTVKRADEAVRNLKKYEGEFLERIEEEAPKE